MNWDWEKLKEKQKSEKQQQQIWSPFNQKATISDDKNKKDDEETEDDNAVDFRNLYKKPELKKTTGNKGGGNGGNGGNIPLPNPFDKIQQAPPTQAIKLGLGAVVLVWLLSGIYIVEPDEAGVVLRFGQYAYTTGAGPHYHLPYPIETVYTPKVTQIRQAEIGFRSSSNNLNFQQGQIQNINDESAMLTGDENIVNIQFSVQYRIKPDEAVNYLFNVTNPDAVLKNAAEAAMREVVGNNNIDAALTDGKVEIQNSVAILLQEILDRYEIGLEVVAVQMQNVQPPVEVSEAFKDVTSAREDRERIINESEAYSNEIIPKARGDAAEIINQAEAYKQTRIRNAEGEANRFLSIVDEYRKNPSLTKERLVYETLESIYSQPHIEKYVISDEIGSMMPVLPLNPNMPSVIPNTSNNQPINSGQNLNSQSSSNSSNQLRPNLR